MTTWGWIVLACLTAFATKLAGYLLPAKLLDDERVPALAASLTVGLLASLTMTTALANGQALAPDSRLLALVVAGLAAWRRAPFIVVVVLGGAVCAAARAIGLP